MSDMFTAVQRHFEDAATRGRLLAHRHKEQGLTKPLDDLDAAYQIEDLVFAVTGEKIGVGIFEEDALDIYLTFVIAYYDEWDEE